MNCIIKVSSRLVVILLLANCSSSFRIENKMILNYSSKTSYPYNSPIISIGEMYGFQYYNINSSNIRGVELDRENCWNIGFGSPIIPLPLIPFISFPKNYSIRIDPNDSLFKNLEEKYNFLSKLKVSIIVDQKKYEAKIIRTKNDFDVNAVFPIKCTLINEGKIVIEEPFAKSIKINIERDTSKYYIWAAIS